MVAAAWAAHTVAACELEAAVWKFAVGILGSSQVAEQCVAVAAAWVEAARPGPELL